MRRTVVEDACAALATLTGKAAFQAPPRWRRSQSKPCAKPLTGKAAFLAAARWRRSRLKLCAKPLTGKAAFQAAACFGAGLCVEAAIVTQMKDNMKDFRNGDFVGFGYFPMKGLRIA